MERPTPEVCSALMAEAALLLTESDLVSFFRETTEPEIDFAVRLFEDITGYINTLIDEGVPGRTVRAMHIAMANLIVRASEAGEKEIERRNGNPRP